MGNLNSNIASPNLTINHIFSKHLAKVLTSFEKFHPCMPGWLGTPIKAHENEDTNRVYLIIVVWRFPEANSTFPSTA